jgi:hypothetical protein
MLTEVHAAFVIPADSEKMAFLARVCLIQHTINSLLSKGNQINLQIPHIYLAKVFENNVKSAPFCKND